MRRATLGLAVLLVTAGFFSSLSSGRPAPPAPQLLVYASPSPFSEVEAGPVTAMIPDDWRAMLSHEGAREGFFASPEPQAWRRMDGSVAGMSATWVDATKIGVPSDYYYLAASGPLLGRLTSSRSCSGRRHVLVDNRPAWMSGSDASPGDYLARGAGRCEVGGVPTRWAYFVAAPGFGEERRVGIPSSALYVVVAVLRDSQRAPQMLNTLLDRTTFGGVGIHNFIAIARAGD